MVPNTITEGPSHLYQIKGIKLITATLLIFAHREFPQFPQVKIRNKTKCVNKATTKTRSVMHLNSNHTTGIPHQPKQWATDSRNLCLHLLTNTTKIIHTDNKIIRLQIHKDCNLCVSRILLDDPRLIMQIILATISTRYTPFGNRYRNRLITLLPIVSRNRIQCQIPTFSTTTYQLRE